MKLQGFHPFRFEMNASFKAILTFSAILNPRFKISCRFWNSFLFKSSRLLPTEGFDRLLLKQLIYYEIFKLSRIITLKISINHINQTINTWYQYNFTTYNINIRVILVIVSRYDVNLSCQYVIRDRSVSRKERSSQNGKRKTLIVLFVIHFNDLGAKCDEILIQIAWDIFEWMLLKIVSKRYKRKSWWIY
jgi:hypothetical protein